MSVPALSVAIAACDRPDGVVRCLRGVLEGTILPAELIVVDQSRDDAVAQALGRIESPVPVRQIRMPRLGLSASRNAAWRAATRPTVAFTDDDCVPDAAWVGTIWGALAADAGLAAASGSVQPLGEERAGTYVVSPRRAAERRDYVGRQVPWAVGTGGNFAARREWLERLGGFDERLGAGAPGRAAEDADLIYRLLGQGARIRYEPAAVVYHERQTAAQRLSSRYGYGYGIGAFCALAARGPDLFPVRLLGGYLAAQAGGLLRAAARRDWFLARQRVLALRGCAGGVLYGLRAS